MRPIPPRRRWGQRGTGFTEYDVHLCAARTDPKVGDPVVIEIEIQESAVGEWPEELHETLADIIQLNPMSGQASIIMRVSCAWDDGEQSYIPKWEFLNTDRNPLAGKGARATNFQEFFTFLPVFYLDALRDASNEFAARSQFWRRLLRTVQIPEPLEQKSVRIFNLLNAQLLAADPLLGKPGAVSGHHYPSGDDSIVGHRCAEVLPSSPLALDHCLRAVFVRSEPERDTLLHLLGDHRQRWPNRFLVSDALKTFEKRHSFVQEIGLSSEGVYFVLNPRHDRQGVDIRITVSDQADRTIAQFHNARLAAAPPDGRWIYKHAFSDGLYIVRVEIDGHLAYQAPISLADSLF